MPFSIAASRLFHLIESENGASIESTPENMAIAEWFVRIRSDISSGATLSGAITLNPFPSQSNWRCSLLGQCEASSAPSGPSAGVFALALFVIHHAGHDAMIAGANGFASKQIFKAVSASHPELTVRIAFNLIARIAEVHFRTNDDPYSRLLKAQVSEIGESTDCQSKSEQSKIIRKTVSRYCGKPFRELRESDIERFIADAIVLCIRGVFVKVEKVTDSKAMRPEQGTRGARGTGSQSQPRDSDAKSPGFAETKKSTNGSLLHPTEPSTAEATKKSRGNFSEWTPQSATELIRKFDLEFERESKVDPGIRKKSLPGYKEYELAKKYLWHQNNLKGQKSRRKHK